jgi:hypothetical protein
MSEEISVGVKILLERGKTSPDETREEYGKWAGIRDAVFNYKERNERSAWLRGLTEHEINLLFDMFGANAREQFDEWVMKTILSTGEDEQTASQSGLKYRATERYVAGFNDPRMAAQVTVGGGGSGNLSSVAQRAEQLGLGHLLKKTLNKIKL